MVMVFYMMKKIFKEIYSLMALKYDYQANIIRQWKHIQKAIVENWETISEKKYAKHIKWIKGFDFDDVKSNGCRKQYRIKMIFNKTLLYPIRRLHGNLHERRERYKERVLLGRYLKKSTGEKIFLIGTPIHSNLGDSAIVLAERLFLEKCGFDRDNIKEITVVEYDRYNELVLKYIRANNSCSCCWHGGGNMGDQWLSEEKFRRRAIEQLSGNKMFIFPQTLYYTNTNQGDAEKERSVSYYDNDKMILAARDLMSYNTMIHLYPNACILAVPDIVLSMKAEDFGVETQVREHVLLCMRKDIECSIPDSLKNDIEKCLSEQGITYEMTDMYWEGNVSKEKRMECVTAKLEEFAKARLVITDRLHGMIFSAITATPCIVFDNNNHKVQGTYNWISYLPYIKFAKTFEDAKKYIGQLMEISNCKYDNEPLQPYYQKLRNVIRGEE
ncbi:MAG: polysaccharide pyruvyl transferase family protein [Clostridiales bacterium]|nr:polysaccharide pyruvyl transferase family protein [Clostridiales bacterium]